jgi:hypothetical protein
MLMKEKSRCSILFHLLVPGGEWQTVMGRPIPSERFWSSTFQKGKWYPLLPTQSAVIVKDVAWGKDTDPTLCHYLRMVWTAMAEVS